MTFIRISITASFSDVYCF